VVFKLFSEDVRKPQLVLLTLVLVGPDQQNRSPVGAHMDRVEPEHKGLHAMLPIVLA
jgi:hypothetical protein